MLSPGSTVAPEICHPSVTLFSRTRSRRWLAVPALLALLSGCDAPRPDLLAAIQRDCQQGNEDACEILSSGSLATKRETDIAPPIHSDEIVQAILAGMRRAKLHSTRLPREQFAPIVQDPKDSQ